MVLTTECTEYTEWRIRIKSDSKVRGQPFRVFRAFRGSIFLFFCPNFSVPIFLSAIFTQQSEIQCELILIFLKHPASAFLAACGEDAGEEKC